MDKDERLPDYGSIMLMRKCSCDRCQKEADKMEKMLEQKLVKKPFHKISDMR